MSRNDRRAAHPGWTDPLIGRPGPHPALLHQRARCPTDLRTLHQGRRAARRTTSTATGGATTRSSARPTASTAPGSCSWKVYVKDGIITWETQQTDYPSVGAGPARSTSPAAARAARRSPGTPTPRPGSATRTSAASCWRCTARRRRGCGDPVLAWARHRRATPSGPRRYKSARGKGGLVRATWERGRPRSSPPPTCTPSRSGARTASPASPRSRRCRWSRTPSGARFVTLIGGSMLSLLRLVRRPAGRLAAGVRRPDRRARVR